MKEKFPSIYKEPIETLQINIGYKCNQACKHCHVNSSPLRTEKMSNEMISLIPKIIEKYEIKTLDITVNLQCFYRFFIYWGEFFFHKSIIYKLSFENLKVNYFF